MFSAVNNGLLDTYQLKSLDAIAEGDMDSVRLERDNVTGKLKIETSRKASDFEREMDSHDNFALRDPYDRVIRCLGWLFDGSIFGE